MARKYSGSARSSGYTILVIDDSPDILDSSRHLLEAEGHRVLTATNGPEGLAVLGQNTVQLILCDYFMPGMTGEEVVRKVRETNHLVQIILVTGYSGEKPARVMMRQLDIQGYHDKSEGAERLLLWVDTALKAYLHVLAMEKHRKGLRYILDITPELHRVQPLDELLQGLLWQIEGLLGAENCFLATLPPALPAEGDDPEGFVALVGKAGITDQLEIRFGTGRFNLLEAGILDGEERQLVEEALRTGTVHVQNGASIVPLMFDRRPLGVIYLDRARGEARDHELLEVFAVQAAAAIQNAFLYDMATTDPLTGTYVRGFAFQ
jgi:two-component system, cell cycle response regulator